VPTRALSATPTAIASASTPIPTTRGASINLFNVDNEITARHNDVFASDVEVSHPLRIGVGYGSYVCYSCTIFSSKVRGREMRSFITGIGTNNYLSRELLSRLENGIQILFS
jgi:hypothetical protein